jgi:hypothetical protein
MSVIHEIWLISGILEAVIGTLEVFSEGELRTSGLIVRVIRIILGPFALLARLFDGIRNLEQTGDILWTEGGDREKVVKKVVEEEVREEGELP